MATKPVSEIFNALASSIGIDTESQEFKQLLSDKRLTEVQVPEELANQLTGGLLTIDAAKNHAEINSHFKVKHLKGVDNRLIQNLRSLNVPDEIIQEVESQKDTLSKINLIFPKLNEYYATQANKGGDAKYQDLITKHNALMQEKAALAESLTKNQSAWEQERENFHINQEINTVMGSYVFGDMYPADDVRLLVRNKLNDKPIIFKRTNEGVGVFQKEHPELKAIGKDNKELTIRAVLDEIVAPYLKKNGGAGAGGNGGNGGGNHLPPPPPPPPGGNKKFPGQGGLKQNIERVKQLNGSGQ